VLVLKRLNAAAAAARSRFPGNNKNCLVGPMSVCLGGIELFGTLRAKVEVSPAAAAASAAAAAPAAAAFSSSSSASSSASSASSSSSGVSSLALAAAASEAAHIERFKSCLRLAMVDKVSESFE
jgi:hypothetical protein